ncbi:molybdate ABC transporter permease subunit [Actinomyces faecalis]|uniref:molybdate ABC transporter permease subunit n=1 Tax=Actinomyces faecalis TaxID=2722820 RepID=UPI001FD4EC69|nr:molybdate ABC transporter permease subunit [Actinomyces faecalis]
MLALLGGAVIVLPLAGLGTRVAWADLPALLGSETARAALGLSLRTCLVATLVSVVLGVPTALVLARPWPGVHLARVLAVLPMTMPPVVAGIALLATLGKRGVLGPVLDRLGLQVSFTTAAVVIAQVFVAMPYLVVTLEAALRSRDTHEETVARTLGAGPWTVLTRITLPLVAPALARGTALALGRSLGEFGATIAFAGSKEGVTRTMPLAIYLERENDTATALALAVVLIALSFVVVGVTNLPWNHLLARRRFSTRPARSSSGPAQKAATPPAADGNGLACQPLSLHRDGHGTPRGQQVDLSFSLRERGVTVDLAVPAGGATAIIGPNGSGKSTACAVLTGLLPAEDGQVRVGGRLLDGDGVLVPAGRRDVALLAQSPGIFTHMSVLDNVAFGPRCRGMSRRQARALALRELEAAGAVHLADRAGSELSGGQAARVALARALATRPAVLVLDEPMAALDVEARTQVRALVGQRVAAEGLTLVLVTHDVLDLTSLASDVVVLEEGGVVETGTVAEVLSCPRSVFARSLTGTAVLAGTVDGDSAAPVLHLGGGLRLTGRPQEGWQPQRGSAGVALVPPDAVGLYPRGQKGPEGSPRNHLPVRVSGLERTGALVTVRLTLVSQEPGPAQQLSAVVTAGAVADLGIEVGAELAAVVKAVQVRVLPAAAPSRPGPPLARTALDDEPVRAQRHQGTATLRP